MAQVIGDVEFVGTGGMRVRVVHEGDMFVVDSIRRTVSGYVTLSDVTLRRVKNNAGITRLD